MSFDIRKGDQVFGPHTREELEAFVASGEVSGSDTIVQESGETVSVETYLSQPKSLKLKLTAPIPQHEPLPGLQPVAHPMTAVASAPSRSIEHAVPVPEQEADDWVGGTIYHKAAGYAVIALCLSFALSFTLPFAKTVTDPAAKRILFLGVGLIFLSAVPAGIIALCGIGTYGKRGLFWKGLCGILIPVLMLVMAIPAMRSKRDQQPDVDLVLPMMAAEINKTGPRMIDEGTRLDRATVGPGRRLVMNLTLVSMKADEIDREAWNKEIVPEIKNAMVRSRHAYLLREGLMLVYRYFGSDGVFFDEVTVDASVLGKK